MAAAWQYGGFVDGGSTPPWGLVAYASWGRRVCARLIDAWLPLLPALLILILFGESLKTIPVLFVLAAMGFRFWNVIRQGQCGQTIGKQVMHIRLRTVAADGPPGVGLSIRRSIWHFLDSWSSFLGYLWPLWDEQGQTFADKLVGTIVVDSSADDK